MADRNAVLQRVIFKDRYDDLSVSSLVCGDGTPLSALQISTKKRRVKINDVVVLTMAEAEQMSWAILRGARRRKSLSPETEKPEMHYMCVRCKISVPEGKFCQVCGQ